MYKTIDEIKSLILKDLDMSKVENIVHWSMGFIIVLKEMRALSPCVDGRTFLAHGRIEIGMWSPDLFYFSIGTAACIKAGKKATWEEIEDLIDKIPAIKALDKELVMASFSERLEKL